MHLRTTVAATIFGLAASACSMDLPPPEDVAKIPADATVTATGLAYRTLEAGNGPMPGPQDAVEVHYSGWTTDGDMFDSSVVRGQPATFRVDEVIAGWTEGLQLMQQGASHRLWIPEKLAYDGAPGRPEGMLVFDVELLEVISNTVPGVEGSALRADP